MVPGGEPGQGEGGVNPVYMSDYIEEIRHMHGELLPIYMSSIKFWMN